MSTFISSLAINNQIDTFHFFAPIIPGNSNIVTQLQAFSTGNDTRCQVVYPFFVLEYFQEDPNFQYILDCSLSFGNDLFQIVNKNIAINQTKKINNDLTLKIEIKKIKNWNLINTVVKLKNKH